jgi:hypothetical protein
MLLKKSQKWKKNFFTSNFQPQIDNLQKWALKKKTYKHKTKNKH